MRFSDQREWLMPALGLTIILTVVSLLLVPRTQGMTYALGMVPTWLVASFIIGVITVFGRMVKQKVSSPLAEFRRFWNEEYVRIIGTLAIVMLAGANKVAFMWTKALLNYLVPFWADPMLARIDSLLFFGHDPWRLLSALPLEGMGLFYHPVWYMMLVTMVTLTAWARPSVQRSALLLSYFMLWSLAGPLIHILLPAGGPIFYESLGAGARFADLAPTVETAGVRDYLFHIYSNKEFGAGAGISAMPSLHVATAAWTVIAAATIARRLLVPISIGAAVIAFLSVALGWHYALDGVVGALAAFIAYRGALAWYLRRSHHASSARPATAAA